MSGQSAMMLISSNKGLQNELINSSSNTAITFFKHVTLAHTLFSIVNTKNEFNGGNVQFNGEATCTIYRAADGLGKINLDIILPAVSATSGNTVAWTHQPGLALLEKVTCIVGQSEFDVHTGEFMHIWSELTMNDTKRIGFLRLIGHRPELVEPASSLPEATLTVPLMFWFCKKPSLMLPLAALDFAETRIKIKFRNFKQMIIGTPSVQTANLSCSLYNEYIHLDGPEHDSLVAEPLEIVYENLQIVQLADISANALSYTSPIQLSHPVKFIAWTVQPNANVSTDYATRLFDFTDSGTNPAAYWNGNNTMKSAIFKIYATELDTERSAMYYNTQVPFDSFTRVPSTGIYIRTFAINPEDPQPTGTLNFSKIDQANLRMTFNTGSIPAGGARIILYVYAYNTIDIADGQIGKEFASDMQEEFRFNFATMAPVLVF